jgi:NitT/TauT family transport system permease protein
MSSPAGEGPRGTRAQRPEPIAPPAIQNGVTRREVRPWSPARIVLSLAMPSLAAGIALWLHRALPNGQILLAKTRHYPVVLEALLVVSSPLFALLYGLWPRARRWAREFTPILAMGIVALCAWDLITLKFALLPLPFFPGPDAVFTALVDDYRRILECAYRSLLLLTSGYVLGGLVGFVTGVLVGWFPRVRYWVMPILRVVGPIPATALIPLSIMLFPSSFLSGTALIALAVWFPMTILTSSGVASVRVSHLDVARTLGAGRRYLILRVAIPSALPNIFVGLFMGLGAAFLTLIAAEAVGVKSGLGWYIDLGRNYAEYDMIYASLIVTAAFFSTIMALLFRVRDYVLVWQRGVLKW